MYITDCINSEKLVKVTILTIKNEHNFERYFYSSSCKENKSGSTTNHRLWGKQAKFQEDKAFRQHSWSKWMSSDLAFTLFYLFKMANIYQN